MQLPTSMMIMKIGVERLRGSSWGSQWGHSCLKLPFDPAPPPLSPLHPFLPFSLENIKTRIQEFPRYLNTKSTNPLDSASIHSTFPLITKKMSSLMLIPSVSALNSTSSCLFKYLDYFLHCVTYSIPPTPLDLYHHWFCVLFCFFERARGSGGREGQREREGILNRLHVQGDPNPDTGLYLMTLRS